MRRYRLEKDRSMMFPIWRQQELENLGEYPVSMPLITKIEQIQFQGPCLWMIENIKKEIIFVRYNRGELVCRKDNQFNGQQFFVNKSKDKFPPRSIDLNQMLKLTRFKLNHEQFLVNTNKETTQIARETGQASPDLSEKGKDHVQGLG